MCVKIFYTLPTIFQGLPSRGARKGWGGGGGGGGAGPLEGVKQWGDELREEESLI